MKRIHISEAWSRQRKLSSAQRSELALEPQAADYTGNEEIVLPAESTLAFELSEPLTVKIQFLPKTAEGDGF